MLDAPSPVMATSCTARAGIVHAAHGWPALRRRTPMTMKTAQTTTSHGGERPPSRPARLLTDPACDSSLRRSVRRLERFVDVLERVHGRPELASGDFMGTLSVRFHGASIACPHSENFRATLRADAVRPVSPRGACYSTLTDPAIPA